MDSDLAAIINLLRDRSGCDFSGYSPAMLERRISRRFVATDTSDKISYFQYLTAHPDEVAQLLNVMTIHVSSFFRETLTFEYIDKVLLPELCNGKKAAGDTKLRVWSAGCSKGEEAYSVAMLLRELIAREKLAIDPEITATDINTQILQEAGRGLYSSEKLNNVRHGLLRKYFTPEHGQFVLNPEIRDMVCFKQYDILDRDRATPVPDPEARFDLIFCCNVLIYFNALYQEIIFDKLYHALAAQGYLVLGETEVPLGRHADMFKRKNECCHVYQKSG